MAAPEIRLSIGLDLEFFRGQMRKAVNIAQSEFTAQLAVKIDRNKLNTELNNLEKAIKRRTYRIEIGGNLEKAPSKIASLKKALSDLEGTKVEISVGGVASIDAKESRKIRTALRASIMGEGGKILVPTSIVPAITNADVEAFKKAVAGKLSGIKVNVGIQESTSSGQKSVISPEEIGRRAREALGQGLTGQVFSGQAAAQVGKVRGEEARASLVGRLDKASLTKGGYNKAGLEKVITELGGTPSGTVSEMRAQAKKLASSVDDALIDRVWRSVKDLQMNMRYSGGAGYGVGQSISRLVNTMSLVSSDPKAARQQLRSLPPDRITTEMAGRASEQAMANTALGQARAPVGSKFQNSFDKYLNAVVNQAMVDASQARQRFGLRQMGVNLSQKLLPAAGETGGVVRDVQLQSRIAAAQARSAAREASALRESQMYATVAGQVPLGNTAPRLPAGNRGGALALRDTIGRAGMPGRERSGIGGMNIPNLPGAGLVQELGTEFAFAAKQVLLFGTAYKALAFLTSFPQQVGDAVGALQTFRNTLNTISPSAGEAAASSQFILDIVDKYNVPLQSARDGFTKLYASMQPAGFSGNEIRDLFLGISQSAATFGMSADKVDRVNYAFAQMASKGQVMSEELKGQLGDVLPGAMAIFAEAAGFKGPEAIKTFSKALEDGAYKGGAMKALLLNVGTIMRKEFGPGAEGAARTFQGSINRMQNSLKFLYESFEPVAIGFLNSVVMPMTAGIKTVTEGFNAFFSGAATKTSGGFAIAQELEKLRPAFDGLRSNMSELIKFFGALASAALSVGKVFLQIAGNPIAAYLIKIYAIIIPLNMGLRAMTALWAANSLQLLIFNARLLLGGTVLSSFRGMMAATGATATATAASIRAGFASTGIGLILVGVGLLIERFMAMNQALADTKEKALGAASAIRNMSQTEARQAENQAAMDVKILQALQARRNQGKGDIAISNKEEDALKKAGVKTGRMVMGSRVVPGSLPDIAGYGQKSVDVTQIQGGILARQQIAGTAARQITDLQFQEKQTQAPANLLPIPPSEGKEGAAAAAAAKETARLEAYRSLQDQLSKAASAADIARIQDEFEERFRLANSYYDLQEARANSFQKITINFQKELLAIEQRRQKAMLDAELDVRKARESVASEAVGTNGSSFEGAGTVFSGAQLQGATSAAAKFNGIANMCSESVKAFYKSLGVTLPGVTAWADTVRTAGETMTDWSKLKAGDIVATGRPGDTPHVGVYTGGENVFHQSRKRGLKAGNYPDLNYFKQGGYFVRPNASTGAGAGAKAPGKILGSERRQTLATQQTGFALNDQRVVNLRAEKRATEETAIAIENYVAAIAPVAEQQLQNSILEKRVSLMKSGTSGNLLDTEIQIFEQQEKQKIGISALTGMMEENNKKVKDGKMFKQDAIDRNKELLDTINKLNIAVPLSTKLTKENAMAQADSAFTERVNALKEEIRLLLISNDAERRLAELRKEYNGDEIQAQKVFDLEKIKKNIEETRALIGDFVSSTTGDYKGFLKAVISGEDAADALKQFQDGLKDKVLTIFLDFAMAPVEKFLKEGLEGLLLPKTVKQKAGELPKEIAKDPIEATNRNTDATDRNTPALDSLTAALAGASSTTGGTVTNPEEKTKDELDKMAKDTATAADDAKDNGEKFKESLGKVTAGIGIAAGSIMGIMAGMSQIKKGGTGNTLMGIGSILASVGGGIGGFMKLAGANGGTAAGGWKPFPARAFANGGMVKGPTLGLVGEGKYNEAIVPLPDGRSIPVQMRGGPGGGSSRDLLASQSQSRSSPSVLSMSFQSTTINGVEYVDRAQLEMAMAETRRVASRDGAARGANLAIDRLANSPSSRRRAGIR